MVKFEEIDEGIMNMSRKIIRRAARYLERNIIKHLLEKQHGIDLSSYNNVHNQYEHRDFRGYQASRKKPIRLALQNYTITSNDSVLDFGCGKGAAIIHFSAYPFGKISGVEYSKELYEICLRNIDTMGIEKAHIYLGDASQFVDIDDYNYFFMANPFGGEIFDAVIRNIEDSYERKKRKIVLIYTKPVCHESVVQNYKFELKKRNFKKHFYRIDTNIYELGN